MRQGRRYPNRTIAPVSNEIWTPNPGGAKSLPIPSVRRWPIAIRYPPTADRGARQNAFRVLRNSFCVHRLPARRSTPAVSLGALCEKNEKCPRDGGHNSLMFAQAPSKLCMTLTERIWGLTADCPMRGIAYACVSGPARQGLDQLLAHRHGYGGHTVIDTQFLLNIVYAEFYR